MELEQIAFILLLLLTFLIARNLYGRVIRNIRLGKPETINGDEGQRWKNVLLVAFGQKKMFKRWIPAVLHLFIYVAFLITQIELIEIFIDGVTGNHRVFADSLGGFYTFVISTIEVLSILALIATVVFLWRRNIRIVPRFRHRELDGWPRLDANLILFGEILLITGILTMNSADAVLQQIDPEYYPDTGTLAISGLIGPALMSGWDYDLLVFLERFGWWLHLLVLLGFILYLPVSKHLHIFWAFPNTWFTRTEPGGKMLNMPEVMAEVKSMLGLSEQGSIAEEEIPEFGAQDVTDLSWKNILDAYTCTECGRCTAVCPANITGKKLSPRKIVMNVRDRAEEIGRKLDSNSGKFMEVTARKEDEQKLSVKNFDDGKSLFSYITREELYACTSCMACIEACPVLIDPLEVILQMRRYDILTNSAGPQEWVPMFTALENKGAVWQMPAERDDWIEE